MEPVPAGLRDHAAALLHGARAVARYSGRSQVGAQRCYSAHRARHAGSDEPAIPAAALESEELQDYLAAADSNRSIPNGVGDAFLVMASRSGTGEFLRRRVRLALHLRFRLT